MALVRCMGPSACLFAAPALLPAEGTALSRLRWPVVVWCLVLVYLLTVVWCLPPRTERAKRAQAIRILQKLGATVTRDENRANEPVLGVKLRAAEIADTDLAVLRELNQLQDLDLSCDLGISDAGLHHLRELKHLRTLDLGCTKISDHLLEDFAELKHLRSLNSISAR